MSASRDTLVDDEKNDWNVNIDTSNNVKVSTPSFIRLFQMKRILDKYREHSPLDVDHLISTGFQSENITRKQIAKQILDRLVKVSIKDYMKKYYKEKEQIKVIELIMNKIIFTQFTKEYQQETLYGKSIDSQNKKTGNRIVNRFRAMFTKKIKMYYQIIVFNTADLMCNIFQYFSYGYPNDSNLAFVCSHWLYQSWNINSVYRVSLDNLIHYTIKYIENDNVTLKHHGSEPSIREAPIVRAWQRYINAQSVFVNVDTNDCKYLPICTTKHHLLLAKLSMFNNFSQIMGSCDEQQILLLQTLLQHPKNREKIEWHHVLIHFDREKKEEELECAISPLELVNVNHIYMTNMYYYIKWTNRCQSIHLFGTRSKQWCEYLINNCNCSSVKNLTIDCVYFNFVQNKLLMKKLASKFSALKCLKILCSAVDINLGWFCKYLKNNQNNILHKNNTKIEIYTQNASTQKELFSKFAQTCQFTQINKINMSMDGSRDDWDALLADFVKYLFTYPQSQLEYLRIQNCEPDCGTIGLQSLMKQFTNATIDSDSKLFALLKVVELVNCHAISTIEFELINQFLEMDIIVKQHLCVILDLASRIGKDTKQLSLDFVSFKRCCQNVCRLMIIERIPINIKIELKNCNVNDAVGYSMCDVFWSYFGSSKIMDQYQQPKYNHDWVQFRVTPKVQLVTGINDNIPIFCVSNIM